MARQTDISFHPPNGPKESAPTDSPSPESRPELPHRPGSLLTGYVAQRNSQRRERPGQTLYDALESAEQVIFALAAAVEAKDAHSVTHTYRVAESARRLGCRLGLPEHDLNALFRGGMVHDIGKIAISETILRKPGPLSTLEAAEMRRHPVIGESLVSPLRTGVSLLPIIRHHHEHFDGTGYPDGLRGEQIPKLARIVAVCDGYDALVTDRPYRKGRSSEEASLVLRQGSGSQWDPRYVRLLMSELPGLPVGETGC
ncbi:MAG: HD-GYP domain-containing protein [Candidatus Dormibacteraeota bacterium]|nr:HD-GYP domain-containing protein [Candidatus Dormibacteraeota bacterium]